MNYANIEGSARLRRVAAVLRNGREHSTLELVTRAKVCAINAIVSELRRNGLRIRCTKRDNLQYYYRLENPAAKVLRCVGRGGRHA